jgi:hypothetical protein
MKFGPRLFSWWNTTRCHNTWGTHFQRNRKRSISTDENCSIATGKIAPSDPAGAAVGTATAAIGIKARKVDNMMPSRQEQVQQLLESRNSRQAYNIA